MFRPSIIALSLLAALSFTGCRTMYHDMYSPRRSYFKPEKDTPRPSEVLPLPSVSPNTPPAAQPPSFDGMAAPSTPAPAPAPEAAPMIPGL